VSSVGPSWHSPRYVQSLSDASFFVDVPRWPSSLTRIDPLWEGVQVDTLLPIADGSLESVYLRNPMFFKYK